METRRLEFQGANGEKCEIIQRGKTYDFYVNGFFNKSINEIRKYFIVSAMYAFLDENRYNASLGYYFTENN